MADWPQNKKEYRKFCEQHSEIPLFLHDWWLDVVCTNGQWEVCLAKDKNSEIIGVLPFYQRRYFGFSVIQMPDLTPICGVWLNYPQQLKNNVSKLSFEKKVITELIEQLPKTAYYAQRHPVQLTNWLPFYWKGFRQTTRYTFQLKHPIELDFVFANLKNNTRHEITKAQKILEITETEDIDLFYEINQLTFERQAIKMPYSLHFLKKLDKALSERNQRKIYLAKNNLNNCHAAIYLVWDEGTVYNLMIGADSKFRSSGAVQLLLWQGIQLAASKNRIFDFEGSMMPNIEPVFRRFGGELVPYHKIYKTGNLLFSFLNTIKNL